MAPTPVTIFEHWPRRVLPGKLGGPESRVGAGPYTRGENADHRPFSAAIAIGAFAGGQALVAGIAEWRSDREAARRRIEQQEERQQQRRGDVYVDLLDFAEVLRAFVERTESRFSGRPGLPGPPPTPSDADQRRLLARTQAFGSQPVREGLEKIRHSEMEFDLRVTLKRKLTATLPDPTAEEVQAASEAVNQARDECRAVHESLIAIVRAELGN